MVGCVPFFSRCPSNGLRKEDLVELVDMSKRWGECAGVKSSFLGQKHAYKFAGLVMSRSDPRRLCSEVVYHRLGVK